MSVTDEDRIESWAAENAARDCETTLYLEAVPVLRRQGPAVRVEGYSGNLRAVFAFARAAHESDRFGRQHTGLQLAFKAARPDVDHGIFDDAGSSPAAAAAALAAFYEWRVGDAAQAALQASWAHTLYTSE